MFAFLLPFIPGKDLLIKVAVGAVMLGLFGLWCYTKGANKEALKHAEYVGQQAVQSQKLLAARVEVVRQIETKYVTRDRIIREKGETITREVPIYVTQADDARCDVNAGFVRSYNAAATNTDTPAPGESDRAPSGVPLSAVAEVAAFNLTLGHRWRERALTCQRLYEEVRLAR